MHVRSTLPSSPLFPTPPKFKENLEPHHFSLYHSPLLFNCIIWQTGAVISYLQMQKCKEKILNKALLQDGREVEGEQRQTIAHLYLESGSTIVIICLFLHAGLLSFQTLHIRAAVVQLQPRYDARFLLFGSERF